MNIIKYFGGKGGMYKQILQYFPKEYSTYIEPFGGAYSVGFHQSCPIEVYNDLYNNVYALFKVISDKSLFIDFKSKCDLIYYDNKLREEFRERLKDKDLSVVDRAFYYYYVNRTSHNGIGGFSINRVVRRNMSKSISDFLSSIDSLYDFHHRLSKVIVHNKDAMDLINQYKGDGVLFYCDPPYEWSTRTKARYDVDMTTEKHQEFIDTILDDNKSKYIISGYRNDLYKKIEDCGFKRVDFEVKTIDGNHKKKVKVESLWFNY